jgi:6,7-dimethyl-8-ribityllumazine synthase
MRRMSTRIALLAAEFNRALVDAMVEAAEAEALAHAAVVACSLRVPGCYELPLVAQALLSRGGDVDALVVLGHIERGETLHGEVMGHVVHRALLDLALEHKKPVGFGIIGPGATLEQAEVRKERVARSAVRAALASVAAMRAL